MAPRMTALAELGLGTYAARPLLLIVCVLSSGCNAVLDLQPGSVAAEPDAEIPCAQDACASMDACEGGPCDDRTMAGEAAAADAEADADADAAAADADAETSMDDRNAEAGVEMSCASLGCDSTTRCVETDSTLSCECLTGYERVDGTCEDVNECEITEPGVCPADARCENTTGGYTCTCDDDFEDPMGDGSVCVHKCELAKCLPDVATCSIVDGTAKCECIAAYLGDGRESCVFDAACEALSCDENATCVVDGDTRSCRCKTGFEGDGTACENSDNCAPDPCMNDGRCIDGLDAYECDCGAGFDGNQCEVNIDECAAKPCLNGGTCSDGIASFSCDCTNTGFTGTLCQVNRDDCTPGLCLNGGKCVDGINEATCNCKGTGFSGSRCESNDDDCTPGLCLNGGKCVDGINEATCNCKGTGFSGSRCEDPDVPVLPDYTLIVDAPATGESVHGVVTVRGRTAAFLNVDVRDAANPKLPLAQTLPEADGSFELTVDTRTLPTGAATWEVRAWDSPPGEPFEHSKLVILQLTISAE